METGQPTTQEIFQQQSMEEMHQSSTSNISNSRISQQQLKIRSISTRSALHKPYDKPSPNQTKSTLGSGQKENGRRERFYKTRDILAQSGLLDLALRVAKLKQTQKSLDQDIRHLKAQVKRHLQLIVNNPENSSLQPLLFQIFPEMNQ